MASASGSRLLRSLYVGKITNRRSSIVILRLFLCERTPGVGVLSGRDRGAWVTLGHQQLVEGVEQHRQIDGEGRTPLDHRPPAIVPENQEVPDKIVGDAARVQHQGALG